MKFEDYGYDCDPPVYADQVEFLSRDEAFALAKLEVLIHKDWKEAQLTDWDTLIGFEITPTHHPLILEHENDEDLSHQIDVIYFLIK